MKLLLALIFGLVPAAWADGISAPVSRTVTLAADEASISIIVAATLDSTQQQVKQSLQTAGLPNPTVVGIGLGQDSSTYPPSGVQMLFSATTTVPAGLAAATAKSLEALRTHLPAQLQGLQYSMALNPSQSSIDAMRQILLPQMLDDSRKQAQSLAAAAGVRLGAILAISDVGGVYGFLRSGDFSRVVFGNVAPLPSSSTQVTFFLSVVFATVP
jgi:hypothetical protein